MSLYEQFRTPGSEFRQAPFWFWNHALDKDTLSWQIDQMKDKGIGGFVMHARHGLSTPYLSDEWSECIRFCREKARDLGMNAWAYDERDWPSGPAGRDRTMTETFGESGWRLSLREMKWMSDWQIANGINDLIPHAFYYSIAGRRKKDSPPSQFFQAPFWSYYRLFADYMARVTAAMTGGEQVAALKAVSPDVAMDGAPDVYYLHRHKEGKHLFFFVNTSNQNVETRVSVEVTGVAEIWDPETGHKHAAPGQRVVGGRLEVPLRFAPAGSCLLVVDPEQAPVDLPSPARPASRRIELAPPWHFNPENGNFVALTKWTLTTQASQHVNELRYQTQFVCAEPLANTRLILDGVPCHAYNLPEGAQSIMAHETDVAVLFDGEPVTEELPWEIDPNFRVLDLRRRCTTGTHHIEIVIKNNGWFPQPGIEEYVWLAGDFRIESKEGDPCLVPIRGIKPGPWEEQGFPNFSGTAAYYIDITLGNEILGKRAFVVTDRVGDLLEVEVNGTVAGVRAWPPYRVEVSSLLCADKNLFVLKVTNSAQNFFEGPDTNRPSGLLGPVWLEIEEP